MQRAPSVSQGRLTLGSAAGQPAGLGGGVHPPAGDGITGGTTGGSKTGSRTGATTTGGRGAGFVGLVDFAGLAPGFEAGFFGGRAASGTMAASAGGASAGGGIAIEASIG